MGFSSSEEDSEDSSLLAAAFLTTTGAAFALRIHVLDIRKIASEKISHLAVYGGLRGRCIRL